LLTILTGIEYKCSKQVDKVQTNVFEDVSAAQGALQVIVATSGDLVSAKRVTAEVRAKQCLGQMSDIALQQLSRGREVTGRAPAEKLQNSKVR
jgi:hypothetical protein